MNDSRPDLIARAYAAPKATGLWERLLAAWRNEDPPVRARSPEPYENRAYVVVTIDTRTGQVSRIGIYSTNASQLTMMSTNECFVDGPSATGDTLAGAHNNLVKQLGFYPCYRWMLDLMPERDRRADW